MFCQIATLVRAAATHRPDRPFQFTRHRFNACAFHNTAKSPRIAPSLLSPSRMSSKGAKHQKCFALLYRAGRSHPLPMVLVSGELNYAYNVNIALTASDLASVGI